MSSQDKKGLFALGGNLDRLIWQADLTGFPAWRAGLIIALRMAAAIGRDLAKGQLTLWAMSLVYTTLLSLVPLLAISFSILKGFGVHNQIEPMLLGLLEPLGSKGVEITERIIEFVDNVKVGVLGSLGFALLFYTVVSLMQKIERAFNTVWHVSQERSLGQRFRDYLSVLVIGPALIFAAVGIGASIASLSIVGTLSAIEPLGSVIKFAGKLIPFLMISGAFSFMYAFIPNLLRGWVSQVHRHLFHLRDTDFLYDLAIRRLADPADRRQYRILYTASGLFAGPGRPSTSEPPGPGKTGPGSDCPDRPASLSPPPRLVGGGSVAAAARPQ
jgi:YihY family inner membrane protein